MTYNPLVESALIVSELGPHDADAVGITCIGEHSNLTAPPNLHAAQDQSIPRWIMAAVQHKHNED